MINRLTNPDSLDDDPDDRSVEALKRYDEGLRHGTSQSTQVEGIAPDTPLQQEGLIDCLQLLERAWPRRGTHAPAARPPRIGRFLIERTLGQGGFGVVYLATDPKLNRQVALKVPRLHALLHPELLDRFRQEARAAAALDHPHIVPVYETGETNDLLYIASAYCPGPTLAEWLAEQPAGIPPRTAALIVAQLAGAVAYSHSRGILHRDLKPANVILSPHGGDDSPAGALPFTPRLTDFGLAKLVAAGLSVTRSSTIMGTPLYMSPEQAEGAAHNIGPPTDVFALGTILYELLTGRPPWDGDSLVHVLDRIRSDEEPAAPHKVQPTVPVDLATVCLKCLRKDPAQRYASAALLADDLGRCLQGEPIHARPVGVAERLILWARRPRRIVDAGIALFVVNFSLFLCMLLLSLGPILDPGDSMASMHVTDLLWSQFPGAAFALFLAAIGIQTVRGSPWALWLGTVGVAAQWGVCLAILFHWIPPYGMYQASPLAKWILHVFLQVLFTLNLGLCLVAAYACRILRRAPAS